ncbi:hypothetical protein [Roseobacter sp.]|uniref:hypothetical protein n=1 Tax=Roseobacter sp. TaxID=1907202 RepID=UPI0032974D54
MPLITRLRGLLTYAILWQKRARRQPPKAPHIRRISDHLARDVGLSDADLEEHRVTMPSQTTHHPRG